MSTTQSEIGASYVKVNRLKDGWTWNVQVSSKDNTVEQMTQAKEVALRISEDLQATLIESRDEVMDDDVAF